MNGLGERFVDALGYAAHAHADQVRKGGDVPYVGHLLGVCSLVVEDGGGEDEAIAALLHDAVEDQGGVERLEDIRRRFGERVAGIVLELTDADGIPKPPWTERKLAYLQSLPRASPSGLRVGSADKLHNARAILMDLRDPEVGTGIFGRFNADAPRTIGYYDALADAFCRLRPGPLATTLRSTVDLLVAESGVAPLGPDDW